MIQTEKLKHIEHSTELCIIGGGLSGIIAAISAARHGAKVILVQDRPVFGGNASSEIRMWVRGAKGLENKETGILSEIELENIYRNPNLNHYLWDSVLYQKVLEEENITALLNCSCVDATVVCGRIISITCWQLTTYTWHTISASIFADCSGDSILAPIVGAVYRHGREARSEFLEEIEPEEADSKTMGMSCLIQARQTDHEVDFIPPPFANRYDTDDDFANIAYNGDHTSFRDHIPATDGCNFWWIELGGEDHSIFDTESQRDDLLKIAFGVWDHIKNRGDHGADNWELEWVGFLPGKRESRRYVGDHILTQPEIQAGGVFDDVIAYGGWPLDDHNPAGMRSLSLDSKTKSQMFFVPSPYGIPYRCIYSYNIENLMFAGRNISASHGAASSARVMGTCSLLGQAAGTAAAISIRYHLMPRQVGEQKLQLLQKFLLDDYCMLPGRRREIPALSKMAKMNLSEVDREILFDGTERPTPQPAKQMKYGNQDPEISLYQTHNKHYIIRKIGEKITFTFDQPQTVKELRIVFDLDFTRKSISKNKKMRVFALKLHQGLDFSPVNMPAHLCRDFSVEIVGQNDISEEIYTTESNHKDLFKLNVDKCIKSLTVSFGAAWASDENRVFACDLS